MIEAARTSSEGQDRGIRHQLRILQVMVQAEFKLPAEFAHYKRPPRLKAFLNLFYHQLVEQGF